MRVTSEDVQPLAGEPSRAFVPLPILRGAAAIFVAAALWTGTRALYLDLTLAFRDAGPSNIPASVRRQIESIERRVPAGAPILLVSPPLGDDLWWTRLFQRALYPRHATLIRYAPPLTPADADALRRHWSIRYGLAFGAAPSPDLGFLRAENLGTLPGASDGVWLGAMTVP